MDILDYQNEITKRETFVKVLESMEFESYIDHVMFGHIKEQTDRHGFDIRLYSAVYYYNVNGGLASSDLIKAIAADESVI